MKNSTGQRTKSLDFKYKDRSLHNLQINSPENIEKHLECSFGHVARNYGFNNHMNDNWKQIQVTPKRFNFLSHSAWQFNGLQQHSLSSPSAWRPRKENSLGLYEYALASPFVQPVFLGLKARDNFKNIIHWALWLLLSFEQHLGRCLLQAGKKEL